MPQCSAPNCRNQGVHLFPKDSKRRQLWESAILRKNFKASKNARLCAAHFTENDYFGQSIYTCYKPLAKFLRKTAVPTIFSSTAIKPENTAAAERLAQRTQKKYFQETNTDPQPLSRIVNVKTDRVISLEVDHEEEVKTEDNNSAQCSCIHKFISKSIQLDCSGDNCTAYYYNTEVAGSNPAAGRVVEFTSVPGIRNLCLVGQ